MATKRQKEKAVRIFMQLIADQGWKRATMPALASQAQIDLATLREMFDNRYEILATFNQIIDTQMLKKAEEESHDAPVKERLFESIMDRLDLLDPYKSAIANIASAARSDAQLSFCLLKLVFSSQDWLLDSIGSQKSGPQRNIHKTGLTYIYLKILRIWLDEQDAGMPRTMAALDSALNRGDVWLERLDKSERYLSALKGWIKNQRQRTTQNNADPQAET